MKRLLLKKLIVISQSEQKSREVKFSEGLNIIFGKNKTGKSSLIKSIFHTFGCRVKFEDDWRKLIDYYILFFVYGKKEYCILRTREKYNIFDVNDETYNLLLTTNDFHDFSNYLTKNIFNIEVEFLTNHQKIINITPPLLFRFQYIDQDRGWQRIGESFSNTGYILNWKDLTSTYVVGFHGEEYYKTKKELSLLINKVNQLESKFKHYEELIGFLIDEEISTEATNIQMESDIDLSKKILYELNGFEKEKIKLREKISELKNVRYEKVLEMEMLKSNIDESSKDHNFAMKQEELLICPFCGTEHKNSIENRTEIVKDIQVGNQLLNVYRNDIKKIERDIFEAEKSFKDINYKYIKLKNQLEKTKSGASVINVFRSEGKGEILKKSKEESKKVYDKYLEENANLTSKKEYLDGLVSEEKRNEIYKNIKKHYRVVLDKLNIPESYMRFRNFVQLLNKTGSELPRLVYAYHTALYLYNLEKGESVFNFLVVDTPNQQGQDDYNLSNINSLLELVLSENGQFIIGTERETDFEDRANLVTRLTQHKNCLTKERFLKHMELLNQLKKL